MKYIKTYEAKIAKSSLLDSIYNFLIRALPDNFIVKYYSGTLNIKDTSLPNYKKTIGFIYIGVNFEVCYKINFSSRTIEGSNINIAAKYICDELNNKIPIDSIGEEDSSNLYNKHTSIKFERKYFESVIDVINNLPSDELSIMMLANKYNL